MTDQSTAILAVSTYGTHVKTHQNKRLSTLKIGYTGIIANILLLLFPTASNVSGKRDTYNYIHLPNKPKLRHNWLFINLTSDELAQVEQMTTSAQRSLGIAVWRNSRWMLPPSRTQPHYHEPHSASDVPKGSPVGFWSIRTDGTKGPTGGSRDRDQIIAEYSKLDPRKAAWWWFPGNNATYASRNELKRYGCRWKKHRRAFAYIGDMLSEGLLALLDNAEECRAIMQGMDPDEAKQQYRYGEVSDEAANDEMKSDPAIKSECEADAPCSFAEAKTIIGIEDTPVNEPPTAYQRGRTAWTTQNIPTGIEGRTESIPVGTKYTIVDIDNTGDPLNPVYLIRYSDDKSARVLEEELIPMRIFKPGDTVFARYETTTHDGQQIAAGTKGIVTKLYRFNPHSGHLRGHSYDVEWAGIGVEWMFEDELAALAPQPHIRVTHGRIVPGGQGSSIAEERKALLGAGHKPEAIEVAAEQCICESVDGPVGWLPAENPGGWIACERCNPQGKNMPDYDPANPEAEKPPAIRIVKPTQLPEDDVIAQAIRQTDRTQVHSVISQPIAQAPRIIPLPMACVGELTGSVVANVHCYGFALDDEELIFLNMGGPRSGVEAIRAKLSTGDVVNLHRWDAPSIELTAGEGNTGRYTAYLTNMQEVRFVHGMLVHDRLVNPNYSGGSKTYLIQITEEQAKGQLLHHVRETVRLPVFDSWVEYLWQAGQAAKLIRNTRTGGGLVMKTLDLDTEAWGRLIQYGIAEKTITIPQSQPA